MFDNLFKLGKIGNLEIKNRAVVPPMLTEYATEDGEITERYIRYYEEKAKGGFGLIICEDNVVDRIGAGFKCIAGTWSDEIMEKHRELTKRVKAQGAKIAVQLYHAGREASSSTNGGQQIVAPSAIPDPTNNETPHELTNEEVKDLVEKFAQSVRRARDVGYDAVELHGAHGYLINQFVSPFSNKRTDEYGGNLMNRLKFPIEIIRRAKELVGDNFPIIYRISADEMVEGGLSIDDTKIIVPILEEEGIAAIHVSATVYKSGYWASAPTAAPSIPFVKYAKEIKSVVEHIPVIAVNKINTPYTAESILKQGFADFVSMGRASIADPYIIQKTKEGKLDEIVYCIGCWQGCQGMIAKQLPVTCLVNPMVGKEDELEITEAKTKKKVMVIGGGPAGMQAAIVAAKRGHNVNLYEKSSKLGGQWLLAAMPPGKEPLNTFTVWQINQLRKLNVKVTYGIEVTEEIINQLNPDFIIIATGSTPITPEYEGVDKNHVVHAKDIFENKVEMGSKIVVVGGGLVAAEVAEHMAAHNRNVTMLVRRDEIVPKLESAPKKFLFKHLEEYNVDIVYNTIVDVIKDDSIVIDTKGELREIECDQVVLSVSSTSNNHLEEVVKGKYDYKIIGDASKVGRALEAVAEAHKVALEI